MIEEVRRIKLDELNNQVQQYETEKSIVETKYGLVELRDKLNNLNGSLIFIDLDFERGTPEFDLRDSELRNSITETERELAEATTRGNKETGLDEITKKIEEIMEQISLISQAKTLYEMGITPIEAMELLESNGIEPMLSEEDKTVFRHARDYSSKSSLIGVHKTRYAPTDNTIRTAKEANAESQDTITINGVTYEYSFGRERDTIHMSMNDEVASHAYGNWDDAKYAVLIPFETIPNEKVGAAAPMDTFTKGGIELSDGAWILCPKKEVDELKRLNTKVHVLGYEGEKVLGFPQPFLTQLGYRAEDVGNWKWTDDQSDSQFRELMEREGLLCIAHTHTSFCHDEDMLEKINKIVAISTVIKDNRLIANRDDIENIMNQLPSNLGVLLCTLSQLELTERTEDARVEANCEKMDIFLRKMQENGMSISATYQDIMRRLCKQTITNFDVAELDMMLDDSCEISEDEKRTIRVFQTDFSRNRQEALSRFFLAAIGDTIFHSVEREILAENQMQENEEAQLGGASITSPNMLGVLREVAETSPALPQQEAMQVIVSEMERELNTEKSMVH